ncbi:MAG: hypothetical protein V4465_00320 [Patescibacteria group bacterium]
MGSKISNAEWGLLVGALATIDLAQVVLDVFAIGLVANRIIDLTVVMALPLYLTFRGFKLDTETMLLIGGSFLAEEIPVVDAAPFWSLVGWRLWQIDKRRKAEADQTPDENRL